MSTPLLRALGITRMAARVTCNTAFPGKVSEPHWDKKMGYNWYKFVQQCSTAIPSEA